jgi:kynurenine formamidase
MYRHVDLTFKPYPAPVGDGDGVIRPNLGYRPEAPIHYEPVGPGRDKVDVLSFYRTLYSMSGVQPGEIFQKQILTTKPWTTCATFYNPQESDAWAGKYLAELPARDLVGPYTLLDVAVAAGGTITADALRAALGTRKPERILIVRTGYSRRRPSEPSADYLANSPVLDEGAAAFLADLGIRVFGSDVRTVDPRYAGRGDAAIYALLNGAGIVVVDDLANLADIGPQHSTVFIGIPLPVRWAVGGPVRAFAVDLDHPTDFVDLTHEIDFFPNTHKNDPLPFTLPVSDVAIDEIGDYPNPWPGRIEPREEQGKTQRATRLTPFRMVDGGREVGPDMYIEYAHGTGTHIEAAFFDPWGRHGVPEEVLKRYIRIPKDRLVGEAVLIDLSDQVGPLQQIDSRHLERKNPGLKPGDICVLRADITDWSFYGSTPGNTPGLSPDAAMWLVKHKIRALVLDFAVEKSDPMPSSPLVKYTPNKIHYFLHKNDIPVVEWCVNMKMLQRTRFVLAICALPASHQGGFPAQVFAVETW